MDEIADPNLYSSTTRLLPNEDRSLAAHLAQSMGLISDWQLIRYHPSICSPLSMCLVIVKIQVTFVIMGYFFPDFLTMKWLNFAWAMTSVTSFLLVIVAYWIHHRFIKALKVRGYLLIRPHFQTLRRIPFIIGSLYIAVNMSAFSTLVMLCPTAIQNPVNSTCKNFPFLDKPYWLLFYAGTVGQGALLVAFYIALCISLIRFHRRAARGRVLPDVLSELAQLSANTGLGVPGMGAPSGRPVTESSMAARSGVPLTRASINGGDDVTETHARIVDIIDQSSANESISRVVMERQADILFYMHQRIACLQEELGRCHQERQEQIQAC